MLSQWLQQARNGQSVWLSDVREQCAALPDHVAVTVQLTLCDGARRDFSLPIPRWADGEQRQFVQQYVTAFVFNALSALSGREMAFYLDLRETEVVALLGELNDIFQVHKTARSGSTISLKSTQSGRPPTLWWLLMTTLSPPRPDSTTSG